MNGFSEGKIQNLMMDIMLGNIPEEALKDENGNISDEAIDKIIDDYGICDAMDELEYLMG